MIIARRERYTFKGREIYLAEFERRLAAGTIEPKITNEARALQSWYQANYPGTVWPGIEGILANIRPAFRARKRLSVS